MNSIDAYVRTAIRDSAAKSPEERNEIYLAARSAIKDLPAAQAKIAMRELFETVKAIEAEFVKDELVQEPAVQKKSRLPHLPKQRFHVPWITILIIVGMLAVMFFSTYLLFSQFQDRGIVSRQPVVLYAHDGLAEFHMIHRKASVLKKHGLTT
ncbi:MAG: hypothetical protein AAGA53_15245 [Pseudomonadota bacterium]